ncbi:PAP2 superfamily protein [Hirsutella rhossiliensis]|uniref:PAP2 superfamily domain-containing protein n=1 Tax=Hirsutella rhossiliensis TaxID=111463 RepID=A0A9P8MP37_9HYPO|nr:PAP2 superfamily domain-containing protein [Hirsutella rhossiliensis]KAH0958539.1 PAP2 superfamily domain-containing protein [Hirsutella rhossiliensis]
MASGRSASASSHGKRSLAGVWKTTHAPDYAGLLVLLIGWILLASLVTPFHRMFFINDLNISYPHAVHERVSVPMVFVYAFVVPLAVFLAYGLIYRPPAAKHEATLLSFAISAVLTGFLTDIVKNAVGRPRPDLLDRCRPASDTKPNQLVTIDVCTAPDGHALHDGWRSFPSGHSSFAFAGLGFLSLFLAGQLHLFRYAAGGRDLSRALLCLLPLIGAALIAISRCEDYRHDVYDVCVGSALGMAVAYWSYRRHWPRLSSPECHEPYPRPGSEVRSTRWHRVRDEEEGGAGGDAGYELQETRTTSG